MGRMMVIWEGRVSPERQDALIAAYRDGARNAPPQMLEHWAARDAGDPDVFRLVSLWENREALDAYRAAVQTPAARSMFEAAGVEPTRTISEVLDD